MRFFILILSLLPFLLLASVADATPFSDGIKAYDKKDYQTALKLLAPLAEQGNPAAQLRVGMMYGNGWGVPVNHEKGVFWASVAVTHGYRKFGLDPAEAGARNMPSHEARKISDRARQWTPSSIENVEDWLEDARAAVEDDPNFAILLYRPLAELGNVRAQIGAAWIEEDWNDENEATKWFNRAADQGNSEAIKILALHGVRTKLPELVIKAKNEPELKSWLGKMYVESSGPTAQYEAAVACWRNICNADARKVIAGKDAERHLSLLKKAAEKPVDEARIALGYLYHYGLGVEKNAAEALRLYKRADGWVMYPHLVGELYYAGGVGVPQNYDEAYYWFYRANRLSLNKGMSPLVEEAGAHVGPVTKFLVYMKVKGWNHNGPAPYILVMTLGLLVIFIAERFSGKHPILRWIFTLCFVGYAIFASMMATVYIFPHSHSCWPECGFYSRLYYYYFGPMYGILLIGVNWLFVFQLISRKQAFLSRPLGRSNSARVSDKRVWFIVLLLNVQTLGFAVSTYISTFLER